MLTIVGAPLIVLTLGIVGTRRRRRPADKKLDNKREVKP